MRIKFNPQATIAFPSSHLKVTRDYYRRYERVNEILEAAPGILDAFHRDATRMLRATDRKRRAAFTSEQLLRAVLVMELEALPYRETVIRIDDSEFLRRFVGIPFGPVMDFTTLSKVYKAIRPATWKQINRCLSEHAIAQGHVKGAALRVDTTVYETNIQYPADSRLLWDGYRVLARWIERVREHDSGAVGDGRLQTRVVKRWADQIARRAHPQNPEMLKVPYRALLGHVEHVLEWARQIAAQVEPRAKRYAYDPEALPVMLAFLDMVQHFEPLIRQVMSQASRRVLEGTPVPHDEKLFSLFEPHTELIKRGKAGKPVEFGHMILLHQAENKFITDYDVFKKRPRDHDLVDDILKRHEHMFGALPDAFAADKGFYESMARIGILEAKIPHVSIAKKGPRTPQETEREHDSVFRDLQRFRAGIEGTISYLKRGLKLARCLYRSFTTYCSSVGSHIFAHNLIVLARC